MKEVFEMLNPAHNFRSEASHFKKEDMKTTQYGIQSVRYLGPKIWDMVPNNVRLCKKCIAQVGFIWFTSTFCNISKYIWKKKITYILYLLIFQIHFVFVHCAEWGSFAWVPGGGVCFFFVRRFCRFFGRFAQGSPETVHFLGIFSLRIGWNFCILCSGCHYLLHFICLFIYLFVIIIIVIIIININNII